MWKATCFNNDNCIILWIKVFFQGSSGLQKQSKIRTEQNRTEQNRTKHTQKKQNETRQQNKTKQNRENKNLMISRFILQCNKYLSMQYLCTHLLCILDIINSWSLETPRESVCLGTILVLCGAVDQNCIKINVFKQ